MPKLTDTQLVILSAAARREGGAVLPVPMSLKTKGAALTKTLEGLCRKGLLAEKPATPEAQSWREGEDGRRMTLVITEAGLQAIDGAPAREPKQQPTRGKTRAKKPRPARKIARPKPKDEKQKAAPRKGTKQALLIRLLKRKTGATIDEMIKATGWQAHSVRAALTGLRKRGIEVTRERKDGVTTYHARVS